MTRNENNYNQLIANNLNGCQCKHNQSQVFILGENNKQ